MTIGKIALTLLFTLGSFGTTPFVSYSGQATGQSTITGYGTYYYTYTTELSTFDYVFGMITLVGQGYSSTLHYELNQAYSGTLELHAVSQEVWNRANIYTSNCTVMGKNSQTNNWTIRLNNVTSFDVTVVCPTQTVINALSGQIIGIQSYSFSAPTDTIPSTLGSIDASTSSMASSLSDILTVEQATRSLINQLIQNIRGDETLFVLADDLDTIIEELADVGSKLSLSNVMNESVDAYLIMRYYGDLYDYDHDKFPYYHITSNNNVPTTQLYLYKDKEYYLTCRIYNPTYASYPLDITMYNQSGNTEVGKTTVYNDYNAYYSTVTLKFTPSSNGYYYIVFGNRIIGKDVTPIYWGEADNLSSEMASMTHIKTQGIQGIIDAIKNLSLNVTNLTVNSTGITYNVNQTDVNNSVTNYNTNINQVYNVENNFGNTLDTQLQSYTFDNTQIISKLTSAGSVFGYTLEGLNGISLITMPLAVALVGIVLIAILG